MSYVNILPNDKKRKIITYFLLFWFNLEVYVVCAEILVGGSTTQSSFLKYAIYCILSIGIIFINKFRFNKKVLCYLCGYMILALANIAIVPWKRYAIVEAVPPVIVALPAFLIISSFEFDLKMCLEQCYPFLVMNSLSLALIVFWSINVGYINYGIISVITYSNTILLWFLFIKGIKKGLDCFVLILFNNIAGIIFGSRMPAIAAILTMVTSVFFLSIKKKACKYIFMMLVICGLVCMSVLFNEIMDVLVKTLRRMDVYSRSLERLYLEVQSGSNVLAMLSDSGRGGLWEKVLEVLKDHFIMPHGFGFVRYYTGYYFSHNIILDIFMLFGILGIFVPLAVSVGLCKYKKENPRMNWEFVLVCLVFFLIRSLTGAHFLSDKYSILSMALIFFSKRICHEATQS